MARAKTKQNAQPAPKEAQAPVEATPPAKDLSHLPTWNCVVEGSPKDKQWTVGETFHLKCDGPSVKFLSTDLQFKLPENKDYQLRILETEKQSENSLYLLVTSYNPGNHDFAGLYIADQGEEVAKVEPFVLQVGSVLQQGQEQKPFGPIMAMKLSYPQYLWFVLLGMVLVGLFYSFFRLRRRVQMKRVIEELKQHNTSLGPFNQFNKDFRQLGRQYIFSDDWAPEKKQRYIESLDEVFRMYLLREFFVPALDWKSKLVLKTISHQDKKRYGLYGSELQQFINELDRAKTDANKLQVHDCKQLTQMAKKVSQTIWKVRKT